MKKHKKIVFLLIFIFLILALSVDGEDLSEYITKENIIKEEELTELIPEEYRGYFGQGDVFSYDYIKPLDGEFFLKYITGQVTGNLEKAARLFTAVLVIITISALCEGFSNSFNGALGATVSYLPAICAGVTVFSELLVMIDLLSNTMHQVSGLFGSLSTVIGGIYLASGNINSSYVGASGTLIMMNTVNFVTDSILIPLLRVLFMLECVAVLSGRREISSFASFTKNTFIQILSAVMTVLLTVFTYQSSVASSADSWMLRSAKFAAGSIPVVGGAISEAAKTMFGSFEVIKGVTGGVGVVVILLGVIPPIVSLISIRWSLMMGSAAATSVGCTSVAGVLKSGAELTGFALALTSALTVGAIFTLTLIIGMGGSL